ncbi:hypothetical protein HGI47_08535 [Novosphingobium sp. ERN07]|uniref:hypothetical protein n=1 Tax=Novosphingobium sp. ERN07 TaxID=2726187 RepID=UPI0014570BCD|nr:hypothetical protein [Novosphingobium sp. ERN07]NLR70918.1 hypothetical protein [Novosphingobium sp. ERN07]
MKLRHFAELAYESRESGEIERKPDERSCAGLAAGRACVLSAIKAAHLAARQITF